MYPDGLKYSRKHQWVELDGNKAKIGITYYAQEKMGDVVFVELPLEGQSFQRGEGMGVIETISHIADIYAPVSGKVVDVNEELLTHPELLNEDPYRQGWLLEIELDNALEAKQLMSVEDYKSYIQKLETGKTIYL
ncbi:glycine cleavage system protein GcvH [Calderihabitans maritimus]|uniref:Glycine cleavage system H protein n=1 Tax=Calderihabitans maritimus TaxID=1246530 RepID=A0A1Z5HTG0_9FIRM|nr:glycine cleavage system protein GcvH [Calderihabitans maritimus]GAW92595.1 Glycine cleavage system, H protein [Calderihabitans maritimus]